MFLIQMVTWCISIVYDQQTQTIIQIAGKILNILTRSFHGCIFTPMEYKQEKIRIINEYNKIGFTEYIWSTIILFWQWDENHCPNSCNIGN